MIFDHKINFKLYFGLGKSFSEAFELISSDRLEKIPGRYDLKNGVYYMVQNYETKPESEGFFEAHRKYIDLQYIVSGKERHGVAHVSALTLRTNYDAEKDLEIYDGYGSNLVLDAGFFSIYFPEDAHMPNLMIGAKAEKMTKVVFKIPVCSTI
jgi:YhcH/YjgK/YiaL family protein